MRIAPKHSVRVNDDEKPYCLLCGAEGKELMEDCTDRDPLDVALRRTNEEDYVVINDACYYDADYALTEDLL